MDGDKIENISTRLHVLEVGMIKVQKRMRRNTFSKSESRNKFSGIANKEMSADKSHRNRIRFVAIENNRNENVSKIFQRKFSKNNIEMNKTILTSQHITGLHRCGLFPPTCLLTIKQNCLYNILWVTVNILSFIVSYYYINNAYNNWQSSPVVQAVSNNQVDLENISFPAVTICWPNSLNKNYDFFKSIENCFNCENDWCSLKNNTCDFAELITLRFAYGICERYTFDHPFPSNIYQYLPDTIEGHEYNMYMEKLLPSCDSDQVEVQLTYGPAIPLPVSRCFSDVFQQFYSSQSNRLCMTYNSLPHKDIYEEKVVTPIALMKHVTDPTLKGKTIWSIDNMMEFNGNWYTVPAYGLQGFSMSIYNRKQYYEELCKNLGHNLASVIIHSPNEIPVEPSGNEHIIGDNFATEIMMAPKITLAREDLAQYPPHQRNCLFAHEKKLTMFKSYTKNNCDLECLIDAYLRSCGCVPHTYPRQNNSVKVCVYTCPRPKLHCDCLPDCNSLSYDLSFQEVPIKTFVINNITIQAVIETRLKGNKFYTNIRYSITSYAEFLAYSLGVLGATLGFSVTCLWQLLYSGITKLYTSLKNKWNKAIYPFPQNLKKPDLQMKSFGVFNRIN